jgi:hypothetical protein
MGRKGGTKKIDGDKSVAKRSGKATNVSNEQQSPAMAGRIAGPSRHGSVQSADEFFENSVFNLREILAHCGHPIEEIINRVLIPKLSAKKPIFLRIGGQIEVRLVDDHDIQLKAALALAKLCSYSAEKVAEVNVDETNSIDVTRASDDEIRAILKIGTAITKRNSAG